MLKRLRKLQQSRFPAKRRALESSVDLGFAQTAASKDHFENRGNVTTRQFQYHANVGNIKCCSIDQSTAVKTYGTVIYDKYLIASLSLDHDEKNPPQCQHSLKAQEKRCEESLSKYSSPTGP